MDSNTICGQSYKHQQAGDWTPTDCQIPVNSYRGGTIGIAYGVTKKGGASMLTAQQEKFAQAIALEGMNQADAYRSAYNTSRMTSETLWVKACEVAKNDKVKVRIAELREQAMTPKVMNAQKRREKLTELAESEDANVAMKAIDLLNKMDGEYTQKVEAEVKNAVSICIELSDD
jgi:hypothetical protein